MNPHQRQMSFLSLVSLLWKWDSWEVNRYGVAIHRELKYWFFIECGCIMLRDLPDGPSDLRSTIYQTNPFSWILTSMLVSRMKHKQRKLRKTNA